MGFHVLVLRLNPYFMKKRIKKAFFVLGLFLLFFAAANPGQDNFSNYKGKINEGKQISNWVVFSIYESTGEKYLGFAFNFFKIGDPSMQGESMSYVDNNN